jgi:hypothetical protein
MDLWYFLELMNYKQEKEYWENQRKAVAMLKGIL